jgi:formate-dependent nitrite reductase membrane component NrfD
MKSSNELQEEVAKWIAEGGKFIQDQAPALCREIVAWGTIAHPIILGVCVVGMISCIFLSLRYFKKAEATLDDVPYELVGFASLLGAAASLVGAIVSAYWALMAYIAPRLYIVETLI